MGNKYCQGRGRSWVKLFVDHGELSAFGCGDGLTLGPAGGCGCLLDPEYGPSVLMLQPYYLSGNVLCEEIPAVRNRLAHGQRPPYHYM